MMPSIYKCCQWIRIVHWAIRKWLSGWTYKICCWTDLGQTHISKGISWHGESSDDNFQLIWADQGMVSHTVPQGGPSSGEQILPAEKWEEQRNVHRAWTFFTSWSVVQQELWSTRKVILCANWGLYWEIWKPRVIFLPACKKQDTLVGPSQKSFQAMHTGLRREENANRFFQRAHTSTVHWDTCKDRSIAKGCYFLTCGGNALIINEFQL